MLLYEEPHADIDVLPPIPHILLVHGHDLASLGYNQYTMIMFIQASAHPSSGTRYDENCKTTKPSSVLSVLLSEESQAIDVLSIIPRVLCVYWQGPTSLKLNQHTGIKLIPAS